MKISTLFFALVLTGAAHGQQQQQQQQIEIHYETMDPVTLKVKADGTLEETVVELLRTKDTERKVVLQTNLSIVTRICADTQTKVVGKKCHKDKYGNEICRDLYETVCVKTEDFTENFGHYLRLNFTRLGPITNDDKQLLKLVINGHKTASGYEFDYDFRAIHIKATKTMGSFFTFSHD